MQYCKMNHRIIHMYSLPAFFPAFTMSFPLFHAVCKVHLTLLHDLSPYLKPLAKTSVSKAGEHLANFVRTI